MPLDELIVTMFCRMDNVVKAHVPVRSLRQRGPLPHLADSEVITIELVGEYLGLNTEKAIDQYFARHHRLVGMRRLIETVNGQLEQQFQIKDVWARDLWHLTVRMVRKLLAHALCVLLNIQFGRDPLKPKALVD